MSSGYARWNDVRARGRAADPRTADGQAAGKAAARERREAYVRGHQLAEMRTAAGLTRAELADVAALGGNVDVVARLGDRSWKVAYRRPARSRSPRAVPRSSAPRPSASPAGEANYIA